jgi:hypothetical protein
VTLPDTGRRVLLFSVQAPPRTALESSVPELVELGAHVQLAAVRRPAVAAADLPLEAWRVRTGVDGRPGRFSRQRLRSIWRTRVIRKVAARCKPAVAAWLVCSHDPRVIASVGSADMLVALDKLAVYTVWRYAQRYPRPDAVYGLTEALIRCRKADQVVPPREPEPS